MGQVAIWQILIYQCPEYNTYVDMIILVTVFCAFWKYDALKAVLT